MVKTDNGKHSKIKWLKTTNIQNVEQQEEVTAFDSPYSNKIKTKFQYSCNILLFYGLHINLRVFNRWAEKL